MAKLTKQCKLCFCRRHKPPKFWTDGGEHEYTSPFFKVIVKPLDDDICIYCDNKFKKAIERAIREFYIERFDK